MRVLLKGLAMHARVCLWVCVCAPASCMVTVDFRGQFTALSPSTFLRHGFSCSCCSAPSRSACFPLSQRCWDCGSRSCIRLAYTGSEIKLRFADLYGCLYPLRPLARLCSHFFALFRCLLGTKRYHFEFLVNGSVGRCVGKVCFSSHFIF